MLHLVYSPHWFYGKDILIDLFSSLVLALIGIFSFKFYKIQKQNKNYLWFAVAFFVLAASFFFKILTNFSIYYHSTDIEQIGFIKITYHTIKTSDILFSIGSFMYFLLGLLGIFTIHEIYNKKHNKKNIALIVYFLVILSFFSFSRYFVFHLTSLILFTSISLALFKHYQKKKNKTSCFLASSFSLLALSQLFFVFMRTNNLFYVVAESLQLIAYLMLLIALFKTLKHGKKK